MIRAFICNVMLLFLFWHLELRWIEWVIYHLKFALNLILMLFLSCLLCRLTYTIMGLLGRSLMDFICTVCFWVTIGRTCLYVPKQFLPRLGNFWVLQRFICLLVPSVVLWCQQLWWLVFPLCPPCRLVTGPEFLPQSDIIFLLTSLLPFGTWLSFSELSWVSLCSHLVGKCQTLTYIKSCEYVELFDYSSPQYWANSFKFSVQ